MTRRAARGSSCDAHGEAAATRTGSSPSSTSGHRARAPRQATSRSRRSSDSLSRSEHSSPLWGAGAPDRSLLVRAMESKRPPPSLLVNSYVVSVLAPSTPSTSPISVWLALAPLALPSLPCAGLRRLLLGWGFLSKLRSCSS
jgi:hypothetical protein